MEIVVVEDPHFSFGADDFLSVHSSQQLVDLVQLMDEGIHPKSK